MSYPTPEMLTSDETLNFNTRVNCLSRYDFMDIPGRHDAVHVFEF